MVNTAVILAAGLGKRLQEKANAKPKGFIEIDGTPIIEMSISKLIRSGIKNIFIGTGYQADMYNNLSRKYKEVQCMFNDGYETTGNLYTLYNMKDTIQDDFLLLESDLIYDSLALQLVLHDAERDVFLTSEFSKSSDEVYVEANDSRQLVNLSKEKDKLNSIYGEMVGISKFSHETYQGICNFARDTLQANPKIDYEQAIVAVSKERVIWVRKLQNLAWCEIDNEDHLHRAEKEIYPLIRKKELSYNMVKRNILLNPGPATTTDGVKFAQIVPDICPREDEFGEVMRFITTELTRFTADTDRYTTVLFGGSGTAAVEAILSSVVDKGTIIIINNGAYGKRMCQIADMYRLNYIQHISPMDEPIAISIIESLIESVKDKISHLIVVHNETTTGLLSDIGSLGKLCRKFGIDLIVDAMSSFGAIPIDMESMNISYLASSSNKNLQGMAGISFVIARRDKIKATKSIQPRNLYLNLYAQYSYFCETGQMRFTPPVQTLYALKQAIIETKQEGIANRYERYSRVWEVLIKGISNLGLKHLVRKENHSKIITAIIEPDESNFNFNEMHDFLYSKGITIYPGKLENLNTFRVANIGDITCADMEYFIALLKQYLRHIKF